MVELEKEGRVKDRKVYKKSRDEWNESRNENVNRAGKQGKRQSSRIQKSRERKKIEENLQEKGGKSEGMKEDEKGG